MKKLGFTLAEVLITLGIIGVISALTLPNVITKYKEFVLKKQFAKFYSNISQAYLRAYNENGMTMSCYYSFDAEQNKLTGWNGNWTECINEGKDVFKYLKVIKKCKYISGENTCIRSYPKIHASGYIDNYYFLSDGTLIITPHQYALLYFAVDLNGEIGPNKMGYDIFKFISERDKLAKNRFYIAPYPNHTVEQGGKSTQEMLETLNK